MGRKSSQPLVSVIIACKNTADYFRECLLSVEHQTYKNIEIIVVDNFSTDGTYEIAKKYADQVYQLGPERSTQFNFGFTKSKGEFIYRIGPDYKLEPDVIEKCVAKMAEGFDALALHNRSVGDSIWAKVRYYERESYRNDKTIVAARFMKRSVFKDLGMFDESLVAGEDFDLHNRLEHAGYKWSHVDAIENHIGEPKTVRDVWDKFFYYGRTINRYRVKNRQTAGKQLKFFRPSFIKVQYALIKQPKLFILFWLYMLIKYTAGLAGLLAGVPSDLPDYSNISQIDISDAPLVSVIIPTKNSSINISKLLSSFATNSYSNIEIIINDDVVSLEDLSEIVQKYSAEYNLKIHLLKQNISMAQGRYVGSEFAKGKYLFHIDSDMLITDNLLNECVELLETNQADAVVVPETSIGYTFWAKVKALEKEMYDGVEQMESIRFISRQNYFDIGGHDKSLIFSEDKDFDLRARSRGLRIVKSKNKLIHNEGSIKLINTLKKKLKYSESSSLFSQKHPAHYRWQVNIFNRYIIFIKNSDKFLKHPVKYIALYYLKTLEYIFSFAGLLLMKGSLKKAILLKNTIKNWYIVPFDKLGFGVKQIYKPRGGGEVICRTKSTDINEIVVCLSGYEYPEEYIKVSNGEIVFDLGANIGGFGLYFDKINHNIQYKGFAFEPFEENFDLLKDNFIRNNISNFEPLKLAITDTDSRVYLNSDVGYDAIHVTDEETNYAVESKKLSTICTQLGISKIDLLKIDIEGSEDKLITTESSFLSRYVKRILVEFHNEEMKNVKENIVYALKDSFIFKTIHQNELNGILILENVDIN